MLEVITAFFTYNILNTVIPSNHFFFLSADQQNHDSSTIGYNSCFDLRNLVREQIMVVKVIRISV